jgi:hypothetical protein
MALQYGNKTHNCDPFHRPVSLQQWNPIVQSGFHVRMPSFRFGEKIHCFLIKMYSFDVSQILTVDTDMPALDSNV